MSRRWHHIPYPGGYHLNLGGAAKRTRPIFDDLSKSGLAVRLDREGGISTGPTTGRDFETAQNDREDAVTAKSNRSELTPEAQLRSFIARFDLKAQKFIRSVRAAFRKRFPTANELAYDYTDSVVISYSPTDHGIDGIVAISARATGVALYFNQGTQLPDPKKLLQGSGKQTRFVPLNATSQLADPDVEALIAAAVEQARVQLPAEGTGKLMIRGAAAKKQPRPKPTK